MRIPAELKYTSDHEWAKQSDKSVRIGITDYAQDALGDVVYVRLPEVGDKLESGAVLGEVESTKSVSEIYAPLSGTVVSVNEALAEAPENLNSDPYGNGWICDIEPDEPDATRELMDAEAYRDLTED